MKTNKSFMQKIKTAPVAIVLIATAMLALPATSAATSPSSGLFVEGSPAFLHVVGTGGNENASIDYIGGTLAFGKRWQQGRYAHKGTIEAGYFYHSENGREKMTVEGDGELFEYHAMKFRASITPLLATYNFCVIIDEPASSLAGEWRIGPTAGAIWVKDRYEMRSRDYIAELKDVTYALGVGTGFTLHFTKNFYMDAGYRYLRAGNINGTVNGEFMEKGSLQMHLGSLTFGYKF